MNLLYKKIPFYTKNIAGLQVYTRQDGTTVYSLVHITLTSGKLDIVSKISSADIQEIKEKLPANVPVALSINGKGILLKNIKTDNISDIQLLQAIMPTANVQDFYLQKNEGIIYIARKKQIDDTVVKLVQSDISIISVTIGVFASLSIADAGEIKKLTLPDMLLTRQTHQWEMQIQSDNNSSVQFQDIAIENNYYEAFSTALLQLLFDTPDTLPIDEIQSAKEDWNWKQLFRISGIAALVFFFALLLINFLVFNNLHSRNSELQSKIEAGSGQMSEITYLQQQTSAKEQFLTESGWMESSLSSYYADRIAAGVPSQIKLTQLLIYPLDVKKLKEDKRTVFSQNRIEIKGVTSHSIYLNEWVASLKKKEWVTGVEVTNYKYASEKQKGEFWISIEI